jgi:hypothetical protein
MNKLFKSEEYNNIINSLNQVDIDKQCLICKEEINYDLIKLDCKHIYHFKCLDSTFNKYSSKKCPYCSLNINLSSHENTCVYVDNKLNICNKKSFNNIKMCKIHTKKYIKKNRNEIKKHNKRIYNEIKKLEKKFDNNLKKIEKILLNNNNLIENIKTLKVTLKKLI